MACSCPHCSVVGSSFRFWSGAQRCWIRRCHQCKRTYQEPKEMTDKYNKKKKLHVYMV